MDIMINISTANETAATYASSFKAITDMKTSLEACINTLKENWKGEAKDNFTLEHFPKLLTSMQTHIDMINVLQQEIASAVKDFDDLEVELKDKY